MIGVYGYEIFCISGCNVSYNDKWVLIENCEKLVENVLFVICRICFIIWNDVYFY